MSTIEADKQSLHPPGIVTLWTLDATDIGGDIVRFSAQNETDAALVFNGISYPPLPVRATGFSHSTRGAQPRPVIEIVDPGKLVQAMIASTQGLRGAKVTRTRTFRTHLDDGTDPDPLQIFPTEIYLVNRRLSGDGRNSISFEMANPMDHAAVQLPPGVALRSFCDFIYRRYSAETDDFVIDGFDPCPFAGDAMFDATGAVVTDRADDVCGKRLSDCKLRFGANAALPYRGMPGIRKFN